MIQSNDNVAPNSTSAERDPDIDTDRVIDSANAVNTSESACHHHPDQRSSIFLFMKQIGEILALFRDETVLKVMVVIFMLTYFGVSGEQLIQTLYLKNQPFSFSAQQVGYYGAAQAFSR